MEIIIPVCSTISNFFSEHGFDKVYKQTVMKHLLAFMITMALKGFSGKISDVAEVSSYERTTIGRFINKDKWDSEYLKNFVKSIVFEHIQSVSKEKNMPFFVSVDDTVTCKTKPSSKAKRPIQGAGFHHSHLEGGQVYGHQAVAVMISCGKDVQNYQVQRYDKTKDSKIAMAEKIAAEMPLPKTSAYALGDSWYTNNKIIKAFASRGYHYIGAIKTNRIIYPSDERMSIKEYAAEVLRKRADFDLVTVNKAEYYASRYEGKLNGIDNAVVIITVPKNGFDAYGNIKNLNSVKAFISTDTALDTVTILEYYTQRWCIETFFRQGKCSLGFDKYQIRTTQGIDRLWLLMSLCHLICTIGSAASMPFGKGLRSLRQKISVEQVQLIHQFAQNNFLCQPA